jgi:hypothetical protein
MSKSQHHRKTKRGWWRSLRKGIYDTLYCKNCKKKKPPVKNQDNDIAAGVIATNSSVFGGKVFRDVYRSTHRAINRRTYKGTYKGTYRNNNKRHRKN